MVPPESEDACMPRYHFNVNGERDDEGYELPNVLVAQSEALGMAGRIICDEDSAKFWKAHDWTMQVTDSDGLSLFELLILATESAAIQSPLHR